MTPHVTAQQRADVAVSLSVVVVVVAAADAAAAASAAVAVVVAVVVIVVDVVVAVAVIVVRLLPAFFSRKGLSVLVSLVAIGAAFCFRLPFAIHYDRNGTKFDEFGFTGYVSKIMHFPYFM
jgi:hypothetical protein